jgi:hypothetical protein
VKNWVLTKKTDCHFHQILFQKLLGLEPEILSNKQSSSEKAGTRM